MILSIIGIALLILILLMRLSLIGLTLLILILLYSVAFGQSTAPVLSWGVALEGYQIERSFDGGTNFKVIAQLPPNAITYTDTSALTDAPPMVTQVCYRIVPILLSGPSFFNDPTCQPFTVTAPRLITMDNGQPGTQASGQWSTSTTAGFFGTNSLYSGPGGTNYAASCPTCLFRWTPNLTAPGNFNVSAWWTVHAHRTTTAPYRIRLANGTIQTITVNQQQNGGKFNSLGVFPLGPGSYVELSGVNGQASADAVRFQEQ